MTNKKENTEVRLKNSALEVFAEFGFHGANMSDIATRANANKASIFYYFHSKENLYDITLKNSYRKLVLNFVQQFPPLSDRIRIEEVNSFLDQFFINNPNILKLLIYELLNNGSEVKKILKNKSTITKKHNELLSRIISRIDTCNSLVKETVPKILIMSISKALIQRSFLKTLD